MKIIYIIFLFLVPSINGNAQEQYKFFINNSIQYEILYSNNFLEKNMTNPTITFMLKCIKNVIDF